MNLLGNKMAGMVDGIQGGSESRNPRAKTYAGLVAKAMNRAIRALSKTTNQERRF